MGLKNGAAWRRTLDEIRRRLELGLDTAIPPEGSVALIGFPGADTNVGNHLMWLAATRYLHSRRRRIAYVAHLKNYRAEDLRAAVGGGPILIVAAAIGGLWPEVRSLGHQVIADFPGNPIVILPQTVSFVDDADRDLSRLALDAHPNLTLIVRDVRSLELARATYARACVVLMPDLAFLLFPIPRRASPIRRVIWLRREDLEALSIEVPERVFKFDWAGRDIREWPLAYLLLLISAFVSRVRGRVRAAWVVQLINGLLAALYGQVAARVLAQGNRIADQGEVFVSDRLHGHLLAVVRGQPTVAMPDAFGKLEALYSTWTKALPFVAWATTAAEAERAISALDGAAVARPPTGRPGRPG